jgi:hypothetical protein
MSLCYDFSKWTIISLASVALTLAIGLVLINFAHGYAIYKNDETNVLDCYEGLATSIQQELPYDVDLKNGEVIQFIKNWCQYQIDLPDKLPIGTTDEFYAQYYPHGIPESVKPLLDYLDTAMAEDKQTSEENKFMEDSKKLLEGLDKMNNNLENGKNDWTPEKCKSMDEFGLKDNLLKQHCPDYKRENK